MRRGCGWPPLGMSQLQQTRGARAGRASPGSDGVSGWESGHYPLLENIVALALNGDHFSNSLRNRSHVTARPCGVGRTRTGHISEQESKFLVSSTWYFMGGHGRPYMHSNTHGESGDGEQGSSR